MTKCPLPTAPVRLRLLAHPHPLPPPLSRGSRTSAPPLGRKILPSDRGLPISSFQVVICVFRRVSCSGGRKRRNATGFAPWVAFFAGGVQKPPRRLIFVAWVSLLVECDLCFASSASCGLVGGLGGILKTGFDWRTSGEVVMSAMPLRTVRHRSAILVSYDIIVFSLPIGHRSSVSSLRWPLPQNFG